MKLSCLSLTLLLAGTGWLFAQQNFDKVEIKATAVAGNIHMLEGAGGNIGVSAGPDGVLIVDDQYAPMAPKIEAALAKLDKGALKFVLNTHWHGDHTGGNAHFGAKAPIVAHNNVYKRLSAQPGAAKSALPVIGFDSAVTLYFNGEEIRVFHPGPGHTDGDSVVHFVKSGVIHMGDQFFNGRFPYIDLGSGGDVEGYIKNVGAVLAMMPADAKVIPGHGPLATKADLQKFHDMLTETTGIVKQAVAEGKTSAQVKAAGLPEKWKDWGAGFINTSRWLDITYNSYSRK